MKEEKAGTPKKEDKPLTAKLLQDQLSGTPKQRMEEEKTLFLSMVPGRRPKVVFTGFWNGRYIRAAMDSVAKAYRLRRHHITKPKSEGNKTTTS